MGAIILFDSDGLVVKKPEKRFSERYAAEFKVKVPMDKIQSFFETEFQLCLEGKADLKEVITPHLREWKWPKSTDELLDYWFSGDCELDTRFKEAIVRLRREGTRCNLVTNNEKYRTDYLIKELDLPSFLDGIFSSSTVGALKSKSTFWEAVHEKIGQPEKTKVTLWDDDQDNINAATAFGYDAHFYSDFAAFQQWLKNDRQSVR